MPEGRANLLFAMSPEGALAFGFWTCWLLVLYSYALYPVVIWVCSRLFGQEKLVPVEPITWPAVTLLIAAYNEEHVIGQTIRKALDSGYPQDKFQIVVGSDGSTDRTVPLAIEAGGDRIRVFDFKQRRGKASVLNTSIQEIHDDIVILSDANTEIDSDAVHHLVRWFSDPTVGAVCGRLVLTDHITGNNVDGLYWKYETFLKLCEARLGALLGANGAIYAIRRDLYLPISPKTIVDDFVIPLLAKQRSNCRILYETKAIAREETAVDVSAEFHRRSRIGAGGFQAIGMLWRMLDPRRGWVAFSFLSHKVLRWLCPFFLIGMLATNLALVVLGKPLYAGLLVGQILFYLIAAISAVVPGHHRYLKFIKLTTMFASMNIALLFGFWRWLGGTQKGVWRRTIRQGNEKEMTRS